MRIRYAKIGKIQLSETYGFKYLSTAVVDKMLITPKTQRFFPLILHLL